MKDDKGSFNFEKAFWFRVCCLCLLGFLFQPLLATARGVEGCDLPLLFGQGRYQSSDAQWVFEIRDDGLGEILDLRNTSNTNETLTFRLARNRDGSIGSELATKNRDQYSLLIVACGAEISCGDDNVVSEVHILDNSGSQRGQLFRRLHTPVCVD